MTTKKLLAHIIGILAQHDSRIPDSEWNDIINMFSEHLRNQRINCRKVYERCFNENYFFDYTKDAIENAPEPE